MTIFAAGIIKHYVILCRIVMKKVAEDVLRSVIHPEYQKDIVELGMTEIDIPYTEKVVVRIKGLKFPDAFLKSIGKISEKKLIGALSDKGFSVEVITEEAPRQETRQEIPESLKRVRNIIAVASGKGGVGKSTVAVNLAVALARTGARTALLDADIYGPSLPLMLGVKDEKLGGVPFGERTLIEPVERFGVKMLSVGFFVDPDKALIWRGPMASNALVQIIADGYWGEIDYMVIDLPPGTGDIHLTLVQTLPVTGAIIVSTPQEVAIADARKGIAMFRQPKIDVPVLGLVENMAWFTPKELPDKKYYIFGKDGCGKLAAETGTVVLGQIPIEESVCVSGDKGVPVAVDLNSPVYQAFNMLANNVIETLDERNRKLNPTKIVDVTHK